MTNLMKLADREDNFFVPKVLASYTLPYGRGGDSIKADGDAKPYIFNLDSHDGFSEAYNFRITFEKGSAGIDIPDECGNWACLMAPECKACQNALEVRRRIAYLYGVIK